VCLCITKSIILRNIIIKKTVAFTSFEDGVRFSEQPHYKIFSLVDDYFFVKEDPKTVATTVALIFNEVIKNNG
jgi:hypothetical protein